MPNRTSVTGSELFIVDILPHVRCTPETPRKTMLAQVTLSEIRGKVEKHLRNSYLKAAQAPAGVKPVLKAWMELC